MGGLLLPGARTEGTSDADLVAAMLRVEAAWARVLARHGALTTAQADEIDSAVRGWAPDLEALATATESAGNPVVPLVQGLRARVQDPQARARVHRGLTSQDVLDTALVLLTRDALTTVAADLTDAGTAVAALAAEHRTSVMAGRTLTQWAVPTTFGLVAAQWLAALDDVGTAVRSVRLPVQCGGAAGTLALVAELFDDPMAAAADLAGELDLVAPTAPWHTRRTTVTRVGDALATVCQAWGVVGSQVALLARPEIGELRENPTAGRGGSSTMPHKQNPVLSVLLTSAARQAPGLAAQLHLAAGQAVDQRPDGAWQAEWPAWRDLLVLARTAAAQGAELVRGLEVHADVMRVRAEQASEDLLAERDGPDGGGGDPTSYLGAATAYVDRILAEHHSSGGAR